MTAIEISTGQMNSGHIPSRLSFCCFSALISVSVLGLGCSSEEPIPQGDHSASLERITHEVFADDSDPNQVLATVGDSPITLGDVAVCLEYMPARTTAFCLNAWIDVKVLELEAIEADRQQGAVRDAVNAGLAFAYLREHILRPIRDQPPTEAELEAFMMDPETRPYFDLPAFRRSSQILASGPDELAMEWAQRVRDEGEWDGVTTGRQLRALVRPFVEPAREAGVTIRVEEGLVFPPHTETGTHGGVMRAVPEFAIPLFAIDSVGGVSQPVLSDFGAHIILLEEIIPPRQRTPEEASALALAELSQRRRTAQLASLIERAYTEREVVWIQENLSFLGAQYDTVFQRQNEEIRAGVSPIE